MKDHTSGSFTPKEGETSRPNDMYQFYPDQYNTEQGQREHLHEREADVGRRDRNPGLGTMIDS